jgi:hypothetical protein
MYKPSFREFPLSLLICMALSSCSRMESVDDRSDEVPQDAWVSFRSAESFYDPSWKPLPDRSFNVVLRTRMTDAHASLKNDPLRELSHEEARALVAEPATIERDSLCYLVRAVSFKENDCHYVLVSDGSNLVVSCDVLGRAETLERNALVVCSDLNLKNVFVEFSRAD